MATIGTFTSTENGFTGSIRTLALNVKARIARVENPSDKGPQFRVYAGSVELGAAWQKTSEQGRDYLSVKLDDRASLPRSTQRSLKWKAKTDSSSSGPARAGTEVSRGLAAGGAPSNAGKHGSVLAVLVPEAGFHQLQISRAGFVQSEYLQRRANRRTYPMLGFALAQFVRCLKHVLMRLDDLQSTSICCIPDRTNSHGHPAISSTQPNFRASRNLAKRVKDVVRVSGKIPSASMTT